MTGSVAEHYAGKREDSRPCLSAIAGGESLVMNPGKVLPSRLRSATHGPTQLRITDTSGLLTTCRGRQPVAADPARGVDLEGPCPRLVRRGAGCHVVELAILGAQQECHELLPAVDEHGPFRGS